MLCFGFWFLIFLISIVNGWCMGLSLILISKNRSLVLQNLHPFFLSSFENNELWLACSVVFNSATFFWITFFSCLLFLRISSFPLLWRFGLWRPWRHEYSMKGGNFIRAVQNMGCLWGLARDCRLLNQIGYFFFKARKSLNWVPDEI